MNESVFEWRRRFFRRHGGHEAAIAEVDRNGEDTGFWLLPDGARCEQSREGACEEPPENEVKRLKRVVRYREEIVRRAEQASTKLKQQIKALHFGDEYVGLIEYHTSDGLDLNDKQEAMRALKVAQAKVIAKRRELAQARKQLKKLTLPPGNQRQQRAVDEQLAKQEEQFRDEIERTRI